MAYELTTTDSKLITLTGNGSTLRTLGDRFADPVNALDFIPSNLHANILNGTSSDDVVTYLQTWLDYVSQNDGYKGYLPAGIYNISEALWVTWTKRPSGFYSSNIEGAGAGSGFVGSDYQSKIVASHTDSPALIISRCRGVRIANIAIDGANTDPQALATPTNTPGDYDGGCRVSRYSPYAGISVDPTLGATPADPYPDATVAAEYQGDSGGSHGIILENLAVTRFNTGIMLSSSNGDQCSHVSIRGGMVGFCEFGISAGQQQSRGVYISDLDLRNCRVGITTTEHGDQDGSIQQVQNIHGLEMFNFFDLTDQGQTPSFSDCYLEGCRRVGKHGGLTSSLKDTLYLTRIVFLADSSGDQDPFIMESAGPVVLKGCIFRDPGDNSLLTFNFVSRYAAASYRFDGCLFEGGWTANADGIVAAQAESSSNGMSTIPARRLVDCTYQTGSESPTHHPDTNLAIMTTDVSIVGGNGGWTIASGQLTFTVVTTGSVEVGDIIMWEVGDLWAVPGMKVTDVTGDNVTADLFFGESHYGNSLLWNGSQIKLYEGVKPASASAAPTVGTWAAGDIVYDSAPAAGGTIGWVCVTAGTPGTWKEFGNIEV